MNVVDKWIEWLDPDNAVQVEWAVAYLGKQGVRVATSSFRQSDNVIATFKSMSESTDRRLFMRGMRCAWSQKKYRDSLKSEGAATYNYVMKLGTRKQLDGIAKARKSTLNAALVWCVEEVVKATKEEKKQFSELRKRHAEEMGKLQKQLSECEDRASLLDNRCRDLECQLARFGKVSIEDIERFPILLTDLEIARREAGHWERQAEDWLTTVCIWEVLVKAHGLEGYTLNPDQSAQAVSLKNQKLADFTASLMVQSQAETVQFEVSGDT